MPFKNSIEANIRSLELLSTSASTNKKTVSEWLKKCGKVLKHIRRQLRFAKTIEEKKHLVNMLETVKNVRYRTKNLAKHDSGRRETAWNRVRWNGMFMSAFNNRIQTRVISNLKNKDIEQFFTDASCLFRSRINKILKRNEAIKVNAVFRGEFTVTKADQVKTDNKYFTTFNTPIYRNTNLCNWFVDHVQKPISIELEEFQEKDSGWGLTKIINLSININKYTLPLGSSYIDLPISIKNKRACINVKNRDNECFAWAVLSALYYPQDGKRSDRTSTYKKYYRELNLKNIIFPMAINQVPRFEEQNTISVNVFTLQKESKSSEMQATCAYHTKNKFKRHVNLLLIQDRYEEEEVCNETNDPIKYHFVWIKDLSRLVSKQLSKNTKKKHFCECLQRFSSKYLLDKHRENCSPSEKGKIVCDRCLNLFNNEETLTEHKIDCEKINNCKVRMPEMGNNILKFNDFKNKEKVPFAIYVNLESVLKPISDKNKCQEHIPASIGYYVKCSYDDTLSFYKSYRGIKCRAWFTEELQQFAEDVETVFLCPYDMTLSSIQNTEFERATHCHICEKPFTQYDMKVRDHFHLSPYSNNNDCLTSNYRGPAHKGCNINYKDKVIVPVIFHNLSGYNAHFILEDIANKFKGRIDLLPVTKEKYISFTKHVDQNKIKFRFIDSFRFLAYPLEDLVSCITDYPISRSQFSNLPEEKFKLLTKKGVYPYDSMDSFDKFDYDKFPTEDQFYNRLEDKHISLDQYKHAQRVWNVFNIQNLGEYTDLYLKTDILLLCDIFEQFRDSCLKTYHLDPAHYFTLPGYSWSCMLQHTKQELELLTDVNQLNFVQRGIRGGLSQCSKRRATANNKYMNDKYDQTKPESYLMYYNVNNQYGWAMSQYLPTGGFEWLDKKIDVTKISNESSTGYFLEVDLEYPKDLHDKHKDLPFCPDHSAPPHDSKNTKLMATLHGKKRYVIHYRNLKQALSFGLVLTKVHRVLKFNQSPWLKSYIDLNTELRKNAKNEFEKNLFKLMNNAVFGKTMENIEKYSIVKLKTKWDGRYGAETLISKPEFKYAVVLKENLVAIELNKTEVFYNKPIYIRMAISDLAKTTIYDFHYGYMGPKFGNDCKLLYTDTDSLIYDIQNLDIYEVMRQDCHKYFDTSDYSPYNPYNIPRVNKKVLGLMKDENNGIVMKDFIGLRSKMYAIELDNEEITKKAKGINKSAIKNKIMFEDYIQCLENFKNKKNSQNLIKSDNHQVFSISQTKIALSPNDDKRHLLKQSFDTLPWGHYEIP